jgi:hypothetical protein
MNIKEACEIVFEGRDPKTVKPTHNYARSYAPDPHGIDDPGDEIIRGYHKDWFDDYLESQKSKRWGDKE